MGEEICNEHQRRIVDLKLRDVLVKEQQKRLKNFINTIQSTVINNSDIEINNEDELKNLSGYFQLKSKEEYSIVGQFNTVYSRLYLAQQQQQQPQQKHRKSIKIFCRIVHTDRMSESFRQYWLKESLLIMRFIRYQQQQQQQTQLNVHRLLQIVHQKDDNRYYLFMDRISLSTSLLHILWNNNIGNNNNNNNNNDTTTTTTTTTPTTILLTNYNIKQWLLQLCQIIESLNQCGIAHRFIRPENILINVSGGNNNNNNNVNHRLMITGFDMACFFHSFDQDQQPILQSKRCLPNDMIEDYLLDHLPPECFQDNYDASMVDVWSIGTIICLLIIKNNPFSLTFDNDKYDDDYNHLNIWHSCWERRTIPEEWRTLLDDIFQESNCRMTVFDLKSDHRLLPQTTATDQATTTGLKSKRPYYRIDLKKNLNTNEKELKKTGAVLSKIQLAYPEFSSAVRTIFTTQPYQQIENEQHLFEQKHFRIERNESFTDEFNSSFINDYYMRSRYCLDVNNQNKNHLENFEQWKIGLVKIFPINYIPNRHKNILINESGKIMKYLSRQIMKQRRKNPKDNNNNGGGSCVEKHEATTEKSSSTKISLISIVSNHIHRLIEIFRTTIEQTNHLLLFYESLSSSTGDNNKDGGGGCNYSSLAKIFSSIDCRSIWPSIIQLKQLLSQLLDVIDYLSRNAISHRYIRPEYIYVDNHYTNLKLGHFEMACFIWNPLDRRPTLRHRGLQDEREHLWNHLPPECFNIKYDSYLVDIWSFGTVLLYCLIQQNPFTVPHNNQQAELSWTTFKLQEKDPTSMQIPSTFLPILNSIFQSSDLRVKISDLKRRFNNLNLMIVNNELKKKSSSLSTSSLSTAETSMNSSNISKLSRISRWKPSQIANNEYDDDGGGGGGGSSSILACITSLEVMDSNALVPSSSVLIPKSMKSGSVHHQHQQQPHSGKIQIQLNLKKQQSQQQQQSQPQQQQNRIKRSKEKMH
ncbi:uncharacterized protein LOC113799847 [Dermatophagoides pteronyssinus]|uniref:uncharacterized protein LOC113799847 n=1 Tax=Dermatophagoides pteronyssinus TaxID=6956 RepID=UPI003F67A31B